MHSIMVIDDNLTELVIAEKALESKYRILAQQGGKQAFDYLKKATILPSLILLDIDMPGLNGFEVFSRIRLEERLKTIPIIFVTGNTDASTELEAYSLGAVDFIRKPFVSEILKKKVDMHIGIVDSEKELKGKNSSLQNFNEQLQEYNEKLQQTATVQTQKVQRLEYFIIGVITDLITKKDGYSGMHCKKVSRYMELLLKEMIFMGLVSIRPEHMELILMSSQLHDMGKIGIPDAILEKVGKYTQEEFEVMKMHTVLASDAVQKFAYLLPDNSFIHYTYQMARSHHEQWCGMGYPDGLAENAIPQLARILSVADVYDALVSERTYKKSVSHEQACTIITQASGIQFDPQVVAAFQNVMPGFYELSRIDIR